MNKEEDNTKSKEKLTKEDLKNIYGGMYGVLSGIMPQNPADDPKCKYIGDLTSGDNNPFNFTLIKNDDGTLRICFDPNSNKTKEEEMREELHHKKKSKSQ